MQMWMNVKKAMEDVARCALTPLAHLSVLVLQDIYLV